VPPLLLLDPGRWDWEEGEQGDGVWGGGLPPPLIIVIKLCLSLNNTPFLLLAPIIDDAVIIMRQLPHFRICIRVRVIVSVLGSVSYLNENFAVF